jgi:hypothetical protein
METKKQIPFGDDRKKRQPQLQNANTGILRCAQDDDKLKRSQLQLQPIAAINVARLVAVGVELGF